MRVVLFGGTSNESQANSQVRASVMRGWAELVGAKNVISTNVTGANEVISHFRPSVVMGVGSYLPERTYFGEIVRDARRVGAVPVFWATEDPYEQDASYRIVHDFDVLFSCDRWGTNFYDHPCARHLPLAGCREAHYVPYDSDRTPLIDVMFCGVAFSSRQEIMRDVMPSLAGLNVQVIGPGWGKFGSGFSDRRIEKDELIKRYASSKIVLNLGRSLHFENKRYMIMPSSPGPRTFEAALAGAFQLFHEDTFEIRRYFTQEQIPSFSTPSEFQTLLHRFLNDDQARSKALVSAQSRSLGEHTYAHRAKQVLAVLKEEGLL